jgi:CRISPR-associated protein Csx10
MPIKLLLKSDLCAHGGDGFSGIVDMDLVYDVDGLPFIPAKRLKGLLRESALEILDFDNGYNGVYNEMFGEAGKAEGGSLKLGNGRIVEHERGGNITALRTRTAMENGRAKDKSMRVMRVVNKGCAFAFNADFSENHREFLELCCKGLRHMGLNRTRGLGEVVCSIEEEQVAVTENTSIDLSGNIVITPREPVIVADRSGRPFECESYLPGSLLCGYFASRYAQRHGEDDDYKRIFLKGAVRFTAAFPTDDSGNVYRPAPMTLKTTKDKKSVAQNNADIKFCKPLGGFICGDTPYQVTHEVFAHHARPDDRAVGRAAENIGQFYTYKALARGQKFICRICGSDADLQKLAELAEPTIRLGRSRTAQYGAVSIGAVSAQSERPLSIPKGGKFRAVVQTPLILVDESGTDKPDVNLLNIGDGFTVTGVTLSETTVAGYVAKWLLPRRQMRAIAEGGVIAFTNDGAAREMPVTGFYGLRTNEGFGELRFEEIPTSEERTLNASVSAPRTFGGSQSMEAQRIKHHGMEYAKNLKHSNSAVSRILEMLRKADGFQSFARELDKFEQPKAKQEAVLVCIGREYRLDVLTADFKQLFECAAKKTSECQSFDDYKIWLKAALTQIKYNNRAAKSEARKGETKNA